jgi:hypothetical protein
MGFKENNTHGKGRPKGSVNKITLGNRERITNFLDENYNQFQEDLKQLTAKRQGKVLFRAIQTSDSKDEVIRAE